MVGRVTFSGTNKLTTTSACLKDQPKCSCVYMAVTGFRSLDCNYVLITDSFSPNTPSMSDTSSDIISSVGRSYFLHFLRVRPFHFFLHFEPFFWLIFVLNPSFTSNICWILKQVDLIIWRVYSEHRGVFLSFLFFFWFSANEQFDWCERTNDRRFTL